MLLVEFLCFLFLVIITAPSGCSSWHTRKQADAYLYLSMCTEQILYCLFPGGTCNIWQVLINRLLISFFNSLISSPICVRQVLWLCWCNIWVFGLASLGMFLLLENSLFFPVMMGVQVWIYFSSFWVDGYERLTDCRRKLCAPISVYLDLLH